MPIQESDARFAEYVETYYAERGYGPATTEAMAAMGQPLHHVMGSLRRCVAIGRLRRVPNVHRGILPAVEKHEALCPCCGFAFQALTVRADSTPAEPADTPSPSPSLKATPPRETQQRGESKEPGERATREKRSPALSATETTRAQPCALRSDSGLTAQRNATSEGSDGIN